MSKVKEFYGKKEKARHQLRRYETRHKKLDRAKKYNSNVYMGCKGYYVLDERTHYRRVKVSIPEHDEEVYDTYDFNQHKIITKIIHRPAYIANYRVEDRIQKIFHVKQCHTDMKYYKKFAARRFRRKNKFDEENYEVLKGSKYKRDYEVLWNLW